MDEISTALRKSYIDELDWIRTRIQTTLMSLFRDTARQSDRSIIRGLQRYHHEILRATGGRLNAELVEDGAFPSSGGRPKKRWALIVRPSQSLFERARTLIEI